MLGAMLGKFTPFIIDGNNFEAVFCFEVADQFQIALSLRG
jgi:hypothetical protein